MSSSYYSCLECAYLLNCDMEQSRGKGYCMNFCKSRLDQKTVTKLLKFPYSEFHLIPRKIIERRIEDNNINIRVVSAGKAIDSHGRKYIKHEFYLIKEMKK